MNQPLPARLRGHERVHVRLGRTVPAIALVPAGARSARVRAAGFQMHPMKPIDGDELRAAVLEMARHELPLELVSHRRRAQSAMSPCRSPNVTASVRLPAPSFARIDAT